MLKINKIRNINKIPSVSKNELRIFKINEERGAHIKTPA